MKIHPFAYSSLVLVLLIPLILLHAYAINFPAISLAVNSSQFQILTKGYGYSYAHTFRSGNSTMAHTVLVFYLFNGTSFTGKYAAVWEDEKATTISDVEVSPSICMVVCPYPSINQTEYAWNMPHPLQQIEHGIPFTGIACNYGSNLLVKIRGISPYPICVTPKTAQKLEQHGWSMLSKFIQEYSSTPLLLYGTLSGTVDVCCSKGGQDDYEVDVYSSDGNTIVGKAFSKAHGHYSLQLPAGNYIIYTYNYGHQAHPFIITAGQNTIINIQFRNGIE